MTCHNHNGNKDKKPTVAPGMNQENWDKNPTNRDKRRDNVTKVVKVSQDEKDPS